MAGKQQVYTMLQRLGLPGYNQSIHWKIFHLLSPNMMNQNRSCRQPDQLTDDLRENFVNVPYDEENSEWEQSDNEDDVDAERNIFDDIIVDDE